MDVRIPMECQWWTWPLAELILAVGIALLLRRFICVLAYVKGRSMQDTLRDGEIVFALRRSLFGEIRRFDVVLCKYPQRKGLFVKRVVGLPGETLRIEDDILYVNGETVEEDFPKRRCLRPMAERNVPDNAYFVMGDNRPASRDSRSVGPISQEDIVAVVRCVVFPFRRIRKVD